MHLSLQNKLLLCFGTVLLVILGSGLVIVSMARGNARTVHLLSAEEVPAVELANQLERAAHRMLVNLREYANTDTEAFLTASHEQLKAIKQQLARAESLVAGSERMAGLQDALRQAAAAVGQFEPLNERRRTLTREVAAQWDRADLAGTKLRDSFAHFLKTQQEAMQGEIDAGLDGEQLGVRLRRIGLSGQAQSLVNEVAAIRLAARAERNMEKLAGLAPRFSALETQMAELGRSLDWEGDKELLKECQSAVAASLAAIRSAGEKWTERDAVANQQDQLAAQIVATAESIAHTGLDSATTTATGAAQTMHASIRVNMASVAFALLLGIAITLFFSRWLTRALKRLADSISATADQTTSAATQVSASSHALADAASQQAASLEQTSASLEEISGMTRQNVESAEQASTLARTAREAADRGLAGMRTMSGAMDDIKASSDDIAEILKSIEQIAFQTNILALNAAIEAARAGEAGAGFAVVADEVRNLAQRSATAAKETAQKIDGAIANSSRGLQICRQVAVALDDIVTKVHGVDKLVEEVVRASREQNQGVSQISQSATQMEKLTQGNAATAEESAAAAAELTNQARIMKEAVMKLGELLYGALSTAPHSPVLPPTQSARRHVFAATAH